MLKNQWWLVSIWSNYNESKIHAIIKHFPSTSLPVVLCSGGLFTLAELSTSQQNAFGSRPVVPDTPMRHTSSKHGAQRAIADAAVVITCKTNVNECDCRYKTIHNCRKHTTLRDLQHYELALRSQKCIRHPRFRPFFILEN